MQIELGLIAATALAGAAIQLRVLAMLQLKLKQIKADQRRRDEEVEARAAERFKDVEKDLQDWEREHGSGMTSPRLRRPDTTGRSIRRHSGGQKGATPFRFIRLSSTTIGWRKGFSSPRKPQAKRWAPFLF